MYEDRYAMTPREAREVKEILERLTETGGQMFQYDRLTGDPVFAGANPIEVAFQTIPGSPTGKPRYIVDHHGVVWTYKARGTSKCPHLPDGGGSPYLSNYVEMWTGKWRKIKHPATGEPTYAKNTVDQNLDAQVQGHEGVSKIDWMKRAKGWKHPFDEPQYPTPMDVGEMESRLRSVAPVIMAQTQAELASSGLEKADEYLQQAKDAQVEAAAQVKGIPEATKRPAPITMEPPAPVPVTLPADSNITEQARAFAEANGIDITGVKGTGRNGRIKISDVRDMPPAPPSAPAPVAPPVPAPPQGRSNQQ